MHAQPENPTSAIGLIARRPAVPVAILLAGGIFFHDWVPHQPVLILIAIGVLLSIAVVLLRHPRLCGGCIAIVTLLLGIAAGQREHFQFAANDIALFAGDEPRLAELQVRLIDDPQYICGPAAERPLPPRQITTVEVLKLRTWKGWIRVTGRLPLQIDQPAAELRAGQIIDARGMLERPPAAMNPGEFNGAAYYRQHRIVADFTVNRADNIHIIADPGPSPLTWLRNKAHHLLAAGFTDKNSAESAILDAMILGNRDTQLRDVEADFIQTGIAYQLSVSGLHIALLAWMVFWACRFLRIAPRKTLLITTCFVLLYSSVSLPSHSGIRSAILFFTIAVATMAGRFTDTRQLLAIAVIAMLLWHPMDLSSLGFQFSFAVCIAIVVLLPALDASARSQVSPDDRAKPRDTDPTSIERLPARVLRFTQFCIVAWLATLPLVAYDVGHTSIWSIPGNLLLFPLVAVALPGGILKILLTLLWPMFAAGFAGRGLAHSLHAVERASVFQAAGNRRQSSHAAGLVDRHLLSAAARPSAA